MRSRARHVVGSASRIGNVASKYTRSCTHTLYASDLHGRYTVGTVRLPLFQSHRGLVCIILL